jgi:hypothetical protein
MLKIMELRGMIDERVLATIGPPGSPQPGLAMNYIQLFKDA